MLVATAGGLLMESWALCLSWAKLTSSVFLRGVRTLLISSLRLFRVLCLQVILPSHHSGLFVL